MRNEKTLIVLTSSYPFGKGEVYLEKEIEYLKSAFGRVILLPETRYPSMRPTGAGVEVDPSITISGEKNAWDRLKAISRCVLSSRFHAEAIENSSKLREFAALKNLVSTLYTAIRIRNWIERKAYAGELSTGGDLFYSCWLGKSALGAAFAKLRGTRLRIISRAHGGDLYEDRMPAGYAPFRRTIMEGVDRICCVSNHGKEYLKKNYPYIKDKVTVSKLGVTDPGFDAPVSEDGTIRIVTCSSLNPVKRIDLLIDGMKRFSEIAPEQDVRWTHIGDGPLLNRVKAYAGQRLGGRISHVFAGAMENRRVLEYYRLNPVDLFVNVSSSEGIPISVMEAQSCSIPVMATDVGGVPEIVNEANGFLLPANPGPELIAGTLRKFARMRGERGRMRLENKINWKLHYDSDSNYSRFVDELACLAENKW